MKNQRHIEILFYRILDWFSAAIAWFLFFKYRLITEGLEPSNSEILSNPKLQIGLLVIPLAWVLLYALFDKYQDIYRYSRLATLIRTFVLSFIGVMLLFFTIMIDDKTSQYTSYTEPVFRLFIYHFGITAFLRMFYLTVAKWRVKSGKVKYNTLLIGSGPNAELAYKRIQEGGKAAGYNIKGYAKLDGNNYAAFSNNIQRLGSINEMGTIIEKQGIEDVILAPEENQFHNVNDILEQLYEHRDSVNVKVVPELYDVLIGKVKMNHINGSQLIEIDQDMMPKYEKFLKRLFDLCISFLVVFLFWPIFLLVAIFVKLSSNGNIIYSQQRIGKNFRKFNIYKFRSMYTNAENRGPQLANDNDSRITPWGKTMRKYRLDELPQFFNVIKGDMSLVGPRPEREFFIDKIVCKAPIYKKLLQVRPGITSWGQVKFGYASSIDEMIERMKYDFMYLENMSIILDLKILFQTISVLVKGKGK